MEDSKPILQDGTFIKQETVDRSTAIKAKKRQTLAQLPVYRASGNLKYVIVGVTKNTPRSLRRFIDKLTDKSDELSTAIGYADCCWDKADRRWYIDTAIVLANNMRQDITILQKNHVVSKDLGGKIMEHIRGILNQLLAWRGSIPVSGGSAMSR